MEIQWSLVLFTVLTGGAGWALGCVAVDEFTQKTKNDTNFIAAIVAIALAAVGGIASVTHLSHPENMLAALSHPTSGIFTEALLVGLTAVFALCYFFLPNLFTLSALDNPSLLILVVLGLLAFSVMFVCRKGLNAAKARLSQGRRPLRRRKREDGGQ